jgi:hypothetical protein
MLHTSGDGANAQSTLLAARVDIATGKLLWSKDTGIHRFKLDQILPAADSTAFVGTRPPVPDQVSEPLLVILDHASGELVVHSLWQRD